MPQKHDQFYTKKDIAIKYINKLKEYYDLESFDTILEPSAGTGNFYLNLPENKRIGLDIDPKHEEIIYQDYLQYNHNNIGKCLVIGNPPFGIGSSLAIKFFNKSAEFAEVIAFIVPRTFRKINIHNKLNLNFHLVYEDILPLNPCCFEPKMNAKCVFQIWEKRNNKRDIFKFKHTHKDFEFLKYGPLDKNNQPTIPSNPDFVIKGAGGECGEILIEKFENLRPKSWHWIKSNIDKDELVKRFKSLDYSISLDTVRQNTISKGELVMLYSENF